MQRGGVTVGPQFPAENTVAQCPADQRECFQVIDPCILRRKKRKNQIYGLPVDRTEINWTFQPRKGPHDLSQIGQTRMRKGDSLANTCWTKFLSGHQSFQ